MRALHRPLSLFVSAMLCAACGAEELDNTSITLSEDSAETFVSEVAQAMCNFADRCNFGALAGEDCVSRLGLFDPGTIGGRPIAVDAVRAAECLDGLAALQCEDAYRLLFDDFGFSQWICSSALVGELQEGDACDPRHVECAPGLLCQPNETGCGACVAAYTCPRGDDIFVDPEGVVVCDPFRESCDGTVCKPFGAVGNSCDSEYDCHPNDDCVEGVCIERAGPGDACLQGPDLSGVAPTCKDGLSCIDEVCVAHDVGLGEGAACSGPFECGAGLYCGEVCSPPLPAGASCDGWVPCVDGFECSGATLTCEPVPPIGDPCAPEYSACADGGFCLDGVCVTQPEPTCSP